MSPQTISNRTMRHALIAANGLASPAPDDLLPVARAKAGTAWALGMLRRLGFVQIDSVSAVARAQHHILFTRNPRYRQDDLRSLLEHERNAFEHWTHDAAVLPVDSYPYWRHYFRRARTFEAHPGYRRYFEAVTPRETGRVLRRIRKRGALRPRELDSKRVGWNHAYFQSPTLAKLTMEFLWRTGRLAVARRHGQEKVYDLPERVIPVEFLDLRVTRKRYVEWACREALLRAVAATPTAIARFLDAVSRDEALQWCTRQEGKSISPVRVVGADGSPGPRCHAPDAWIERLDRIPEPPSGLRLLNPFDPLIRDRQRTSRLFGFDYRIEIWVPAAKRRYGYYVLPILEGDRFTGRVDLKAERDRDRLLARGPWWEPGIRETRRRRVGLQRELEKLARFVGVRDVAIEAA